MLIRASGPIHTDFYLLTLGRSCHYLVNADGKFSIFDPGLTVHLPHLVERIRGCGLNPADLEYVFLTHLHADRAGGVPALKKLYPHAKIAGSPLMRTRLYNDEFVRELFRNDQILSAAYSHSEEPPGLSFEEFKANLVIDKLVVDADLIRFENDMAIRVINYPGHTAESLAYFVQPYHYLIVDEGLGYYNGRKLAAPGGDHNLKQALESIAKFNDLDIAGICFPNTGVMTGNLVRKHIQSIIQNTNDLIGECLKAYESGIAESDIEFSLRDMFYNWETSDPIMRHNLELTLQSVLRQLREMRSGESPASTSTNRNKSE
jgi:glyoxylase-like metal-dependent hydrolase (beta-lactamase superfamily II)